MYYKQRYNGKSVKQNYKSIKGFLLEDMPFYILHKIEKEGCGVMKGNMYLANCSPYGVNSKYRHARSIHSFNCVSMLNLYLLKSSQEWSQ
jgi:hypothetical protein